VESTWEFERSITVGAKGEATSVAHQPPQVHDDPPCARDDATDALISDVGEPLTSLAGTRLLDPLARVVADLYDRTRSPVPPAGFVPVRLGPNSWPREGAHSRPTVFVAPGTELPA